MGTLWQDLRFGARVLLRRPAFTLVAVLTLALGIGANTAIFSVINAVLLSPLPFPDQERLVDLYETFRPDGFGTLSVPNLRDWQRENRTFEGIAGYAGGTFNLQGGDAPQRLQGLRVEANYFDVLGLRPQIGRTFLQGEDEAGRDRVVVISDALWRSGFGADAGIVGKSLPLNGESYTVVGVMPPSVDTLSRTQLWSPLVFTDKEKAERNEHWVSVIGRLKEGVTREQAQADLATIAARLEREYPDAQTGRGATVRSYEDRVVGGVRQPLLVLMAAVLFVLLIACANVANLLLARSAARQREIAVRVAVGAGRLRLVRQFVTEGVLLSVAGGAVGVGAAWLGLDLLGKIAFAFVPRSGEIRLDLRVLCFTLLVSVVTGIVFGVAPAAQAFGTDVQGALKEGGSPRAGLGGAGLRSALVVAEIAAAFVLLVGAGLLIKSFARLQSVDPGVRPENVLTAKLSLPEERYKDDEARARFHRELIERVSSLPGVEAAAVTSRLAVQEFGTNGNVPVEGKSYPKNQEPHVEKRVVSPDYFRALGVTVLRGRSLDARDTKDAPPVAVINEAMARAVWGDEDPVGKRVFGPPGDPWVTVVGVVSDVRNLGLARPPAPELYLSYQQSLMPLPQSVTLVVRSRLDPAALTAAVRREAQSLDPAQPLYNVQTMQAVLDSTVSDRRLNVTLLGTLAALSLVLAVVGIYGVMSYTVTQHTREIGVRMALGARGRDILRLVVGRGMLLAAFGVAAGLAGSLALTRFIAAMLFDVQATDAATFAAITALLAGVALLACLIPALRAARVDPMIALRHE
jgi:putative ABC transport system permease protein